MEWAFRIATDAGFGAGHLIRCGALAATLEQAHTVFTDPGEERIFDNLTGWAKRRVREDRAGTAERAIHWLGERSGRGLIVDSYALDGDMIAKAARCGQTVMFRDGPPYGPEHISVDPNPGAGSHRGVLAGPGFFPLPARLCALRETALQSGTPADRPVAILIAFGQRDSKQCTAKALAGLCEGKREFDVTVVLGPGYPDRAGIFSIAEGNTQVRIVESPEDLASLYADFQLAIGAPGVSQFERACCGLPTILVAQNERQQPLAAAWEETGAAVVAPAVRAEITSEVDHLMADRNRLNTMRDKSLATVDGKGAGRLAAALMQSVRDGVS